MLYTDAPSRKGGKSVVKCQNLGHGKEFNSKHVCVVALWLLLWERDVWTPKLKWWQTIGFCLKAKTSFVLFIGIWANYLTYTGCFQPISIVSAKSEIQSVDIKKCVCLLYVNKQFCLQPNQIFLFKLTFRRNFHISQLQNHLQLSFT